MDWGAMRAAVEQRLVNDFAAIPLDFEHVSASAALITAQEVGTPWLRVTVRFADTRQISPNAPLLRTVGEIYLDVFTIDGAGRQVAEGHLATAVALFERQTVGGLVRCRTARARQLPTENQWLGFGAAIPFFVTATP